MPAKPIATTRPTSPALEPALLIAARQTLNGDLTIPAVRATRTAALLVRSALEDAIDRRCQDAGLDIADTNMRSRLICLTTLVNKELGRRAAYAWAALSGSCHQHAYDLAPTTSEVSHLLNTVSDICRQRPGH